MQSEQTQGTNNTRQVATYLLALGFFAMASALMYFTWQIGVISRQVPDILASVEKTSNKIEPVVQRMDEIRVLVLPVLDEMSSIREQVPEVLKEARAIRQQIPGILAATERTVEAVNGAVQEVRSVRPLIPDILTEVKLTREMLPGVLDRADRLVANARIAGKEASKGAVSGLLSGIIVAPFEMVGSLGKTLFSFEAEESEALTPEDVEIATITARLVASSDKINFEKSWNNPDSDKSGSVILVKIHQMEGRPCKTLNSVVRQLNKVIIDKEDTICLTSDNEWQRVE